MSVKPIENFIDNRMEVEEWENLDDVIEEAITRFGMESVEKELTENNSNYLEYLWRVQDLIVERQKTSDYLKENPYDPKVSPHMPLIGSDERFNVF